MLSRRDFGGLVASVPLSALLTPQTPSATRTDGVTFGLQTFSFHDLPPAGDPRLQPTIISNMQAIGVHECEIMSGHVEPYAT